jgi:hemerythrin-like domain-containing protein
MENANAIKLNITSTVIDPVNPDWASFSFLIPHEPIRMEMNEVSKSLEVWNEPSKWKAEHFYRFYAAWMKGIGNHHDVEEKLVFPSFAKKFELPLRMTEDHKSLLQRLAKIESLKPKLLSNNEEENKNGLQELKQEWEELKTSMFDHLAAEEETITPLIRQHLTEAEFNETIQEIIKLEGLEGAKCDLPRILKAMNIYAGEEYAQNWATQQIPFPLRVMLNNFWIDSHEKEVYRYIIAIQKNEPIAEEESVLACILQ